MSQSKRRRTGESTTSRRLRTGQAKPFGYSYRIRGPVAPVKKYHITDTNGDTLEDMRSPRNLEEPPV